MGGEFIAGTSRKSVAKGGHVSLKIPSHLISLHDWRKDGRKGARVRTSMGRGVMRLVILVFALLACMNLLQLSK